jgi:hypothetical protein
MVPEWSFLSHARPGSLHIFGGQKSSSSHACSYTPSFLRTLKQVLKSIASFNVIWLLNIRLAFTEEWISFFNCLALLLVIGPPISSVILFGDEWMLGMSPLQSLLDLWIGKRRFHFARRYFLFYHQFVKRRWRAEVIQLFELASHTQIIIGVKRRELVEPNAWTWTC